MKFLFRKPIIPTVVIVVAILGIGLVILSVLPKGFIPFFQGPGVPVETKDLGVANPKIIGTSVEGRKIEAYTYGNGETHLAFVGGIHGGYEWNSVLLAYKFMDYLNEHSAAIPENIMVTVIPSANPDGLYKVIGKEGRFAASDVPYGNSNSIGRFNAHHVDLNRNFDCKWQPESTWRGEEVSGGTAAFSEPEARAIKNFVLDSRPDAVVFWHSQANAVYASECLAGILPETRNIMNAYARAAGYPAVDSFDAYVITGDAEGWLASVDIPAITVELATHETIEWERNLAGISALFQHYDIIKTNDIVQ